MAERWIQLLISIFFDLQKGYDILRDLYVCGFPSNLPLFSAGFFQNRQFLVHIGSVLSSCFSKEEEECVPQGSVLPVTSFILCCSGILQLSLTVHAVGFVDYLQIFCSVNMRLAEWQLRYAISRLFMVPP